MSVLGKLVSGAGCVLLLFAFAQASSACGLTCGGTCAQQIPVDHQGDKASAFCTGSGFTCTGAFCSCGCDADRLKTSCSCN